MNRSVPLFLVLVLTISSLIMVKPTWAQTKPSIPEFAVNIVGKTSVENMIDPYTGTNVSRMIDNREIEVLIERDNSYNMSLYSLFYNVRTKGHFENDAWNQLYYLSSFYNDFSGPPNMQRTGIEMEYSQVFYPITDYPPNAQVDFQVQALLYSKTEYQATINPYTNATETHTAYNLQGTSNWSSTQTIAIPDASTSSPTQSPSIPEFPSWIILPLLIVTLFSAGVIRKRKSKVVPKR